MSRRPAVRALAAGLAASCAAIATLGCASSGGLERPEVNRRLRSHGVDPAAIIVPFDVTPEMKAWAERVAPRELQMEQRLDRLFQAVIGDLKPVYEGGRTTTASQVFAERRANCLGFTSLLVGLARAIDIPTYYLAIDDIERFQRAGDLVVISSHVSAAFDTGARTKVLDFTAAPVASYHDARALDDVSAIGLFYSNLGAEKLRAGDVPGAATLLKTAVLIAPELSGGRVNLGVALRRTGDEKGAEAEYRAALEVDPQSSSAYQNLASLLRQRGEETEAEELLRIDEKQGTRNPYSYLSLGDLALKHRRFDEARRLYRRALRLYGKDAEPYAAMGLWALAQGDEREARKWLRRARDIDQDNVRVRLLDRRLAEKKLPGDIQG